MRLTFLIVLCVIGCASTNTVSEVLTPAEDSAKAAPAPDELHRAFLEQLQSLGYEGVGLQYETSDNFGLLQAVFRDPRVAGRRIRLVYTGMQMVYEVKAQALTIGGLRDPQAIVDYIVKNVPRR